MDPVNSFAERSDSAVAVRNATNPSCLQTSSNSTRTTLDYPQHRTHGCGHDALLTQSLDNRCAVTHMPTLRSCAWPKPVDRLEAIGPDTLGMADMPKSAMIWVALPPSVVGAPLSRDRDKPPMACVTCCERSTFGSEFRTRNRRC